MRWARHPRAPWYLGVLSFAESSFFPIPPDVILAPMSMAKPACALWFASLTTVASVLGGMFGLLIGMFAFERVAPGSRADAMPVRSRRLSSGLTSGGFCHLRGQFFAHPLQGVHHHGGWHR